MGVAQGVVDEDAVVVVTMVEVVVEVMAVAMVEEVGVVQFTAAPLSLLYGVCLCCVASDFCFRRIKKEGTPYVGFRFMSELYKELCCCVLFFFY